MAVVTFQTLWIGEMFMTAIFMSFSRNGKRSRKRKTEITEKYNRKALADGWIEQARRRKEIECRIRHMIVRYFASEWCMNSLCQKEKIYRNGSFSISSTVCPCTTKPPSSPFWSDNVGWKIWLGGCRFSGGEMTGKFRKVASHSAPEPAFGLFLNLPEGSAPWNPGTPIA